MDPIAAFRLEFDQILQKFHEIILIASAIPKVNCEAYKFWKTWFCDGDKFVDSVSWDTFNQAVNLECTNPSFYEKNIILFKEVFGKFFLFIFFFFYIFFLYFFF